MIAPLIPLLVAAALLVLIVLSFTFLPTPIAWLLCAILLGVIIVIIRSAASRPFH